MVLTNTSNLSIYVLGPDPAGKPRDAAKLGLLDASLLKTVGFFQGHVVTLLALSLIAADVVAHVQPCAGVCKEDDLIVGGGDDELAVFRGQAFSKDCRGAVRSNKSIRCDPCAAVAVLHNLRVRRAAAPAPLASRADESAPAPAAPAPAVSTAPPPVRRSERLSGIGTDFTFLDDNEEQVAGVEPVDAAQLLKEQFRAHFDDEMAQISDKLASLSAQIDAGSQTGGEHSHSEQLAWLARAVEWSRGKHLRGTVSPHVLETASSLLDKLGHRKYRAARRLLSALNLPHITTVLRRRDIEQSLHDHFREMAATCAVVSARLALAHPKIPPSVIDRLVRIYITIFDNTAAIARATQSRVGQESLRGVALRTFGDAALVVGDDADAGVRLSRDMIVATLQCPFVASLKAPIFVALVDSTGSQGASYAHVLGQVIAISRIYDITIVANGSDAAKFQHNVFADWSRLAPVQRLQSGVVDACALVRTGNVLFFQDFGHYLKRAYNVGAKAWATERPSGGAPLKTIVVGVEMLKHAVGLEKIYSKNVPSKRIAPAAQQETQSFKLMSMRLALGRFSKALLAEIDTMFAINKSDARALYPAEYYFIELMAELDELLQGKVPFSRESYHAQGRPLLVRARDYFACICTAWSTSGESGDALYRPRTGFAEDGASMCERYIDLIDALFAYVDDINEELVDCDSDDEPWRPHIHALQLVQGALESFFGRARGGQGSVAQTEQATHFAAVSEIEQARRPPSPTVAAKRARAVRVSAVITTGMEQALSSKPKRSRKDAVGAVAAADDESSE
jgi:hypothetical protein